MRNIEVERETLVPIQEGIRRLILLAEAGIADGAAGAKSKSESRCYGDGYIGASLLAAAERGELVVSASPWVDEVGRKRGHWIFHGPGAFEEPPVQASFGELWALTQSGLRLYDAYGTDLTNMTYPIH